MDFNWWHKHYDTVMAWAYIVLMMWLAMMLTGCATITQNDYRLDTTPDHDGEHYIGVK